MPHTQKQRQKAAAMSLCSVFVSVSVLGLKITKPAALFSFTALNNRWKKFLQSTIGLIVAMMWAEL